MEDTEFIEVREGCSLTPLPPEEAIDPDVRPSLEDLFLLLFLALSELERKISLSRAVREEGRELRASYMSIR